MRKSKKMDQIVTAAMRVFSREGFHDARMDQVAQEAGVGKGTVYLYFSSKESLLEHIFITVTRGYLSRIKDLASGPGSSREKLEGIFTHALEIADQNRDSSRFLLEGPTGMSEDFKKWMVSARDAVLQEIVGLIEDGVRAGEIRSLSPVLTAHIIIGAINSLVAARLWTGPEGLPSELAGDDADWPRAMGAWATEFLWPCLKVQ